MRRRSKKQVTENRPSLVLSAPDGVPWMTFPAEVVDSLRQMVTRVGRSSPFPARLSILASLQQEGVTYLSRALGMTMAHDMEATICVVELNWWRPTDNLAGTDTGDGLAAVLAGETELKDAIIATGLPNLSILSAGYVMVEKRDALARSSALKETIDQLSQQFDHLILDIPAVLTSTAAVPLASLSDAACVVVRQGVTSVGDARQALDEIDHLHILGVVMNKVNIATPSILLQYIPQH